MQSWNWSCQGRSLCQCWCAALKLYHTYVQMRNPSSAYACLISTFLGTGGVWRVFVSCLPPLCIFSAQHSLYRSIIILNSAAAFSELALFLSLSLPFGEERETIALAMSFYGLFCIGFVKSGTAQGLCNWIVEIFSCGGSTYNLCKAVEFYGSASQA